MPQMTVYAANIQNIHILGGIDAILLKPVLNRLFWCALITGGNKPELIDLIYIRTGELEYDFYTSPTILR